eukprot:748226-Hanusia_phi.AAC.2
MGGVVLTLRQDPMNSGGTSRKSRGRVIQLSGRSRMVEGVQASFGKHWDGILMRGRSEKGGKRERDGERERGREKMDNEELRKMSDVWIELLLTLFCSVRTKDIGQRVRMEA